MPLLTFDKYYFFMLRFLLCFCRCPPRNLLVEYMCYLLTANLIGFLDVPLFFVFSTNLQCILHLFSVALKRYNCKCRSYMLALGLKPLIKQK